MTPMIFNVVPGTARIPATALTLTLAWVCMRSAMASPQASDIPTAEEATVVQPIEISDVPSAIDPATLMNPRLAASTTVEFDKVSMKELYRWLQEEQKLSVSVDATAMKEKGILSSELVTDSLDNEPLYLILDRLKSTSDLLDTHGRAAVTSKGTAGQNSGHVMVVENSVLIIRQMREVHEEIDRLLDKLTTGERPVDPNALGGMGGGGGGFGGGFFDVH